MIRSPRSDHVGVRMIRTEIWHCQEGVPVLSLVVALQPD